MKYLVLLLFISCANQAFRSPAGIEGKPESTKSCTLRLTEALDDEIRWNNYSKEVSHMRSTYDELMTKERPKTTVKIESFISYNEIEYVSKPKRPLSKLEQDKRKESFRKLASYSIVKNLKKLTTESENEELFKSLIAHAADYLESKAVHFKIVKKSGAYSIEISEKGLSKWNRLVRHVKHFSGDKNVRFIYNPWVSAKSNVGGYDPNLNTITFHEKDFYLYEDGGELIYHEISHFLKHKSRVKKQYFSDSGFSEINSGIQSRATNSFDRTNQLYGEYQSHDEVSALLTGFKWYLSNAADNLDFFRIIELNNGERFYPELWFFVSRLKAQSQRSKQLAKQMKEAVKEDEFIALPDVSGKNFSVKIVYAQSEYSINSHVVFVNKKDNETIQEAILRTINSADQHYEQGAIYTQLFRRVYNHLVKIKDPKEIQRVLKALDKTISRKIQNKLYSLDELVKQFESYYNN